MVGLCIRTGFGQRPLLSVLTFRVKSTLGLLRFHMCNAFMNIITISNDHIILTWPKGEPGTLCLAADTD